jgi:predicted nucleic acid-binding Zn ribbon protein
MQTDESESGETHTEVFSQDAIAGEIMTKDRKDGMNSNFFFLFSLVALLLVWDLCLSARSGKERERVK